MDPSILEEVDGVVAIIADLQFRRHARVVNRAHSPFRGAVAGIFLMT